MDTVFKSRNACVGPQPTAATVALPPPVVAAPVAPVVAVAPAPMPAVAVPAPAAAEKNVPWWRRPFQHFHRNRD